jgi:hypothetical protein
MDHETRVFPTRTKRDAKSLIRLLSSIDERYSAKLCYDYTELRWGVSHNLPQWALNQARSTAYRRGAHRQVDHLDQYCRPQ